MLLALTDGWKCEVHTLRVISIAAWVVQVVSGACFCRPSQDMTIVVETLRFHLLMLGAAAGPEPIDLLLSASQHPSRPFILAAVLYSSADAAVTDHCSFNCLVPLLISPYNSLPPWHPVVSVVGLALKCKLLALTIYIYCMIVHLQTNQRISYAFTSSPFSFHARHILPTSKFQSGA